MTRASSENGITPCADDSGWEEPSITRSFVLLMIPVTVLSAISLLMWHLLRATPDPPSSHVLLGDLFNVNKEVNLPTWFNAGLWLCSGLVASVLARGSLTHRRSWWLFAAACLYFSVDEATLLHERLNPAGTVLAGRLGLELRYAWVLPGIVIASVIALLFLRFVLALPRTVRLGIILAGTIFITGAVGGELVTDIASRATTLPDYRVSPVYVAFNAVEEFLEMSAVALCLASLLSLLSRRRDAGAVMWTVAERAHGQATGSDGAGPVDQRGPALVEAVGDTDHRHGA